MKADYLYTIERGITLDGVHLFVRGAEPAGPTSVKGPGYLRFEGRWYLVRDGQEARVTMGTLMGRHYGAGGMNRDLAGDTGYITDLLGDVTHLAATAGDSHGHVTRLWRLTYLGRSGGPLSTIPYRMRVE